MHPNHSSLAAACSTPFKANAKGAKLAVDTPAWTRSFSSKIQFDGVIGTDGFGVIMFNPSPYNDRASIWYSNDAAQGYNVPLNNQVQYASFASSIDANRTCAFLQNGIAAQSFVSLPFGTDSSMPVPARVASGNLTDPNPSWAPPDIRSRVVSGSYKVTFSGSTLNDQGMFYNFVEPNHENLLGQTVQQYGSVFTSLKPQRAAVRGVVENTVSPVNRKQMELSEGYEDDNFNELQIYTMGFKQGQLQPNTTEAASSTGILMSPCSSVDRARSFTSRPQLFVDCPAYPTDWVQAARAVTSMLYPLSRRNAAVYTQSEVDTAGAATGRTLALANTGTATWVNAPKVVDNMVYSVTLGGSGAAPVRDQVYVWYSPELAQWRYAVPGAPASFVVQAAIAATIQGVVACPPIIAATILQGFQPGTTFHVEAIIHVEYSGRGVQGSTTPCVPDPLHQSIIQQAVSNAREHAAQHEHARPQDAFVHSVVQTAAHHAPDLAAAVIGTVAPEAMPMAGPLINMLQNFSKKRKL